MNGNPDDLHCLACAHCRTRAMAGSRAPQCARRSKRFDPVHGMVEQDVPCHIERTRGLVAWAFGLDRCGPEAQHFVQRLPSDPA